LDSKSQTTRVPVCFGYGRHSTSKQDLTDDVQEDKVFAYYERELEHQGVEWAGWFYDRAVSGGKNFSEREKGRIVFATAQPGDHVVITRLDRAFRKLSDGIATLDQLAQRGVHLHSIHDKIDTSCATGFLIRNVLLAVGQFKRDVDSERTKESLDYLRSQGLPYSNSPPVGWEIIVRDEKRLLRVHKKERVVLDVLAEAYAKGMTYRKLAFWCWSHPKKVPIKRNLNWPTQVRHALQARMLGYPKVTGRLAIDAMYREAKKLGQV